MATFKYPVSVDKTEQVAFLISAARCRFISRNIKIFNMDLEEGQCLVDGSSQTVGHMVRRIPTGLAFIVCTFTNYGLFVLFFSEGNHQSKEQREPHLKSFYPLSGI